MIQDADKWKLTILASQINEDNLLTYTAGNLDGEIVEIPDDSVHALFDFLRKNSLTAVFLDARTELKRIKDIYGSHDFIPRSIDLMLINKIISGGDESKFPGQVGEIKKVVEWFLLGRDMPTAIKTATSILKVQKENWVGMEYVLQIETMATAAFIEMESEGIKVDITAFDRAKRRYEGAVSNAKYNLYQILGQACPKDASGDIEDSINSPAVMLKLLQDQGVQIKDSDGKLKKLPSTKKDVISRIVGHDKIRRGIAEFRDAEDLLERCEASWLSELDGSDFIRAKHNQIAAVTGRNSTESPNLNGVPKRLKKMFVADEGEVIITADYDQCELRILAHTSKDPALMKGFETGVDMHTFTAQEIFGCEVVNNPRHKNYGLRDKAKGVNFGIPYGQTPKGLAMSLGCSFEEATDIISKHKIKFKLAHQFLDFQGDESVRNKESKSVLGRTRYFDKEAKEYSVRNAGKNMVMQGTAADIIKLALGNLMKSRLTCGVDFKIWNSTYDSISVRAKKEDEATVKTVLEASMNEAMKSIIPSVPPKVSITAGPCWA